METETESEPAQAPWFVRWLLETENPTWIHLVGLILILLLVLALSPLLILGVLVRTSIQLVASLLGALRWEMPGSQLFWDIVIGHTHATDGLTGWFRLLATVRAVVVVGLQIALICALVAFLYLLDKQDGGAPSNNGCWRDDCDDYDPRR